MKLNISLFKKDVQDFKSCLRPHTQQRNYQSIKSDKKIPNVEYDIFLFRGRPSEPKWLPFIRPHVKTDEIENLKNTINSAVILFKLKTTDGLRIFALSSGNGHHLLNKDVIEPQFGLLTTLNGIDPEKLKLVDSKKIGVQTLQKREASNLETKLADFGFEFDAEILHIVSGACADEKLGTRISGSDSLHLTSNVDLVDLPEKCRYLFKTYQADTYKKNFNFIDHIKLEKSASTISKLNEHLVAAINQRLSSARISVAYPDQIEYEKCDFYHISGHGGRQEINEVTLSAIYEYIGDSTLRQEDLKKIKLIGFESTTQTAIEPLYAYLTFETELDGKKYVLCNRKWYNINGDYLDQLNKDLEMLVVHCSNPILKNWRQTYNDKKKLSYLEEHYNKQYERDPSYLHLDRKLFHFGARFGPSKVEVADLFHLPSKKLICVKRLAASATLSHLFSQATVSAELFRQLSDYRKGFIEQVNKKWPLQPFSDADIDSLTFVYAVGSERQEKLLDALPIFSKVMLLKHVRMLQRARFRVELAKIEMLSGPPPAPVAAAQPRRRGKSPAAAPASP